MTGETDLNKLLAAMEPTLHPAEFAFATVARLDLSRFQAQIWGWFREPEGITLILEESAARAAGLEHAFACRLITLKVHSSLAAVGFLAVITARLAEAGISVNAVSAYHHDHLFVPVERAAEALQILREVMAEAGA